MKDLSVKTKIIIAIIGIVIVTTIGVYYIKFTNENNNEIDIYQNEEEITENIAQEDIAREENITVHIIGEVKYPGVVVLKEGARVVDAIEAAGGETDDADLNSLNLAYMLNDGEKIYVPNKQETKDENKNYIEEGGGTNISQAGTDQNNSKNEKININTAGEDELMKITGIGESTAKKIIEYRNQNGRFKTIEDIKKIPGIGDSKYNNMKEEIRVK